MRTAIAALTLVLCAPACMRETIEQPRPTEAAMDESKVAESPTASTVGPGLLDQPEDAPEEFGAVRWGRDLEAALLASERSGKPVFLLFTEVPGCSTVKGFANGPLRHPLVVEAIEDEFHPVVVRNNVGGKEREILKSFDEPTWNNPVVRFLSSDRADLVPRYARGWTTEGLTASMVAALEASDRPVPGYLRALHAELAAPSQTTVFSMYCFWTGEVKLAGLDGVIATRPGFANGREVVEVTWDSTKTTAPKLIRQAAAAGAATGVLLQDRSLMNAASRHMKHVAMLRGEMRFSEKDDKYQIRKRRWGWVPMTAAQATAVNRAVVTSGDVASILSPRQIRYANSDERFDVQRVAALRAPNQK